jgi:DNA (cytosine-5)-methyltransferase 3A
MKVLSLFDGMACGMLAMQSAGLPVERYVAFEIDKYAVQTSSHNFPMIEHRGDVFHADFTEFSGFDFLVGGSPCTYWSIAQKNNRETEASGMGWELFSQYVRALHEVKPKYFIYENNKSMSKAIRDSIDKAFGFEAVFINSALVSAQNRQRLYWVGKRNPDGTYSQVHVEQPEDRGILLKDVLDSVSLRDKANCLCGNRGGCSLGHDLEKSKNNYSAEPVRIPEYGTDKARPLGANYPNNCGGFEHRMFSENRNKQQVDMIAQPVGIGYRGRMEDGKWVKRYESNEEPKANALTTCQYDSMVAEPMRIGTYPRSDGEMIDHQQSRIYSPDAKSTTLNANGGGWGAKTGLYAIPIEFDGEVPVKAVSGSDGKTYTVYQVKDGLITIKGKQYPIKLVDGYYIIRKLTVSECKRLQTVPEWYEFPVSDTQAYKMLGNGWTVEVISHLIRATQEECGQMNIFEMGGEINA